MAKYKFSLAQKYAVYSVLGPKCVWCKKPVFFEDVEIDHIIPESIEESTLKDLVTKFKLAPNFTINSFYNWASIHSKCNKSKSADTFNAAPFIAEILHRISKKVPEIEKTHADTTKRFKNSKITADIINAIQKKAISLKDIKSLLKRNSNSRQNPQREKFNKVFKCKIDLIKQNGQYGKTSPKQLFNIIYAAFDSEKRDLKELNSIFQSQALAELMNSRDNYFNYLKDIGGDDPFSEMDSSLEYDMYFTHISKNFISYTSTTRIYNTGAAHENYAISGISFSLNPVRKFNLSNLIVDYEAFINKITPIAYRRMISEIIEHDGEDMNLTDVTDHFPIEKDWLTTEFGAFKNYYFTSTSIVFVFNPYEISAWSFGAHFPEFKLSELIDLFLKNKN